MPDRLIRDELLESDRWLNLPNDTMRLVYVCLLFQCDDFGNFEAGFPRLLRFVAKFSDIRTEKDLRYLFKRMEKADLIMPYEVDGRAYFHVMRFRPNRQYLVQKCPKPGKAGETEEILKGKKVVARGHAKDLHTRRLRGSNAFPQGVGVVSTNMGFPDTTGLVETEQKQTSVDVKDENKAHWWDSDSGIEAEAKRLRVSIRGLNRAAAIATIQAAQMKPKP